jgi:hypothetical protein
MDSEEEYQTYLKWILDQDKSRDAFEACKFVVRVK